MNGLFRASDRSDATAASLEDEGKQALSDLPASLRALPRDDIWLRPFEMMGLDALRSLLGPDPASQPSVGASAPAPFANDLPALDRLIDLLAADGKGLIMVMGKGGVGKTTIAAAVALGLVERGQTVHLSTTDPAAHLAMTIAGEVPALRVDRIDPKAETLHYGIAVRLSTRRDKPACAKICDLPARRRLRYSTLFRELSRKPEERSRCSTPHRPVTPCC